MVIPSLQPSASMLEIKNIAISGRNDEIDLISLIIVDHSDMKYLYDPQWLSFRSNSDMIYLYGSFSNSINSASGPHSEACRSLTSGGTRWRCVHIRHPARLREHWLHGPP
jgi:hypothetical protein